MKKTFYKSVGLMNDQEQLDYVDSYIESEEVDKEEEFEPLANNEAYLTDSGFQEWLANDNDIWWEDVSYELKNKMYGRQYYIKADLGLWYGRRQGHTTCEGFEAVLRCISDMDAVEIYEERGTLKINAYHHDGVNNFTIKEKTSKGLRSPHLWKKIYGAE